MPSPESYAPPLVECRDVTVYRGETRALDRLTLTIAGGEHVAILGPNGCGKSTFIKTLTCDCYPAIEPTPFTLRIMGRDRWSVAELRQMLGIVSQDLIAECTRGKSSDFAELPHRVTGLDTVLSGFFSSIGIPAHVGITPAMQARAAAILDRLEIAHLAPRPLDELSSGEARRLVIARALVHDPAALVLDEVANSLDLRAAHQLREMTRAIAQAGTALVIVTHNLSEIIPEIDRVILMRGGRVVEDGPKERLLTSDALTRAFDFPIDVGRRDGYFHAW
ncbi:MAG TPA: ATP-binding cassette domain-containing protein [Vicinamibacterales bacterium]|jgi:iron complex transport system ATP-binding protein